MVMELAARGEQVAAFVAPALNAASRAAREATRLHGAWLDQRTTEAKTVSADDDFRLD